MRVLSGIQPTGRFHWGNYFGAIQQYIDLQNEEESYYFIANLHALTTIRDSDELKTLTLEAAIDLLALGLQPEQATLFVQSDVPEVSELTWLLMTGTPMGLLERCHAYKEKKEKALQLMRDYSPTRSLWLAGWRTPTTFRLCQRRSSSTQMVESIACTSTPCLSRPCGALLSPEGNRPGFRLS